MDRGSVRLRDVVVGAFVVLGVTVIVGGILTIRGIGIGGTVTYRIRYDNVATLAAGSPVKYHGLLVGRVRSLVIDPEQADRIRVTIEIRDDTPVTTSTVARITKSDLLGDEYVELRPADAEPGTAEALRAAGEPLPPGSFIVAGEPFDLGAALKRAEEAVTNVARLIETVNEESAEVIESVQQLLTDARDVISPENRERVETTLTDLSRTADRIDSLVARHEGDVDSAIVDAREATRRLRITAEEAQRLVAEVRPEVRELVGQVGEGVQRTEELLAEVRDAIDDVDLARVNELLENLQVASRNLAELSRNVKDRPYLLLRPERGGDGDLP